MGPPAARGAYRTRSGPMEARVRVLVVHRPLVHVGARWRATPPPRGVALTHEDHWDAGLFAGDTQLEQSGEIRVLGDDDALVLDGGGVDDVIRGLGQAASWTLTAS